MNKIYKVIYSKVKKQYIVVSELAKAHTKCGVRSERRSEPMAHRFLGAFLTLVLAAGGFVLPVQAENNNITAYNQNQAETIDNGTGNLTNIYVQENVGKVGVNRFQNFDVGNGSTANLNFNSKDNKNQVDQLVNMVKSQINVAGTVNAIKNNKIDGHLYFLSSQGMAVTGSGVINAGQLTVLTPVQEDMERLLNSGVDYQTTLDKVVTNPGKIALNPSGTITVAGKIKAPSGIALYAGKGIKVAKEEVADGTASPVLATEFEIETESVNIGSNQNVTFAQAAADGTGDIILSVSATDANENNDTKASIIIEKDAQVNARGTAGLYTTAASEKGGVTNASIAVDGKITAKIVDIAANVENKVEEGTEFQKGIEIAAKVADKFDVKLSATIAKQESNASVVIGRDAVVTAKGTDGKDKDNKQSALQVKAESNTETKLESGIVYADVNNAAKVQVDGVLAAEKGSVDLAADANMKVETKAEGGLQGDGFAAIVNIISSDNTAEVAINKEVKAKGDVSANAAASTEMQAAVEYVGAVAGSGDDEKQDGENQGEQPGTGEQPATPGEGSIENNPEQGGDKPDGEGEEADKPQETIGSAALNIVVHDSKAQVTLADGAKIAANGDVSLTANNEVKNTITTSNAIGQSKFADLQDKIKENINKTTQNSKDALKGFFGMGENAGAAGGSAEGESAEGGNASEPQGGDEPAGGEAKGPSTAGEFIESLLNGDGLPFDWLLDKLHGEKEGADPAAGESPGQDNPFATEDPPQSGGDAQGQQASEQSKGVLDTLKEAVTANASVQVAVENNTSSVVVGNGAQIRGYGKENASNPQNVTLNATTEIQDTQMYVEAQTQQTKSTVSASGAVLVANMDNDSRVTVGKGAEVNAAKNIDIKAKTEMPYNRVDNMADEVKKAASAFEKQWNGVKALVGDKKDEYSERLANIKVQVEGADQGVKGVLDYVVATQELINLIHDVQEDLVGENSVSKDQYENFKKNAGELLDKIGEFAKPENYTNFYVHTAAVQDTDGANTSTQGSSVPGGNAGEQGEQGGSGGVVAASGSFNINSVNNNATVLVGKKAKLAANLGKNGDEAGTLSIGSETKGSSVSFTGSADGLLPNKAGKVGVGASVGVELFGGQAKTLVAEQAELSGKDIAVDAKNDLTRTSIVFGAGKAGTAAINGMVNVLVGDANALALVDDEAKLNAAKNVQISAANNSTITNVAGGISASATAAIGAGVAVNVYDVNTVAGIVDNDSDAVGVPKEDTLAGKAAAKAATARKVALKGLNDEDKALLGNKSVNEIGAVTTANLVAGAEATGTINAIGVAGAGSSSGDNQDAAGGSSGGEQGKKSESIFDQLGGIVDKGFEKINNAISSSLDKTDENGAEPINQVAKYDENTAGSLKADENDAKNLKDDETFDAETFSATAPENNMPDVDAGSDQSKDSFHLSGAGSVAVNVIDGQTLGVVEGTKIKIVQEAAKQNDVEITARDDAFTGAWAGAAAINMLQASGSNDSSSKTSVAIAGTAAANDLDRDVAALAHNNEIIDADALKIDANKAGASVAAGLGLAVTASGGGEGNVDAAAGVTVSYNGIASDIHALAVDNHVSQSTESGMTDVDVHAYSSDIQVTGGVNADVAISSGNAAAVGAAAVISNVKNDVHAGIIGTSKENNQYKNINNMNVDAGVGTKQITAGVGVGIASGQKGAGLQAVVVYNGLNNDVNAVIDNAEISAKKVEVQAFDDNGNGNTHAAYLESRGVDADGSSYKKAVNADEQSKKQAAKDIEGEKDDNAKAGKEAQDFNAALKAKEIVATDDDKTKGGNLIVGGALTAAYGTNGGVGAAVDVQNINNTRNVTIANSAILANTISGKAETETVLVSTVAGFGGGDKLGGAGSVSWQDVDNSAKVYMTDNNLSITPGAHTNADNAPEDANSIIATAKNDTLAVNVAGQVSAGKAAAGLAVAVNNLDNTTGAYISGGTITGTNNDAEQVLVTAESTNKIYSVGAGVSATTGTFALNGSLAFNTGSNDTQAIIGGENIEKRTKIENIKTVNANAKDTTVTASIAGGVTAGSGPAAGVALAVNDIGTLTDVQQVTATIQNADITTNIAGAEVATSAEDDATMVTVAAGVGISSKVAMQGSMELSLINKKVTSSIQGTKINTQEDSAKDNVNVKADAKNQSLLVGTAVSAAGGSTAAFGAGIAVNSLAQNTQADITNSMMNVKNADVSSTGTPNIYAVGVGLSASRSVGAAGNIAVNSIKNDNKALVENAAIDAQNNISVIATNDEALHNYAGSLGLAVGGQAGVGLGLAYNEITSETLAQAKDSTLNAQGKGDGVTLKYASDTGALGIKDLSKDTQTVEDTSLVNQTEKTKEEKKSGVVIAADSRRKLQNITVSAGAAISPDVGVGVAANVAVNNIKGSTQANLVTTDVNKNIGNVGDVTVLATDYTKSQSIIGAAAVGIGASTGGAAAAAASDTLLVTRKVSANVNGNKEAKNTVNANELNVNAKQVADVLSSTNGLALSAGTYFAGSAAATVGVANLQGETTASVKNINSTNNGFSVSADHKHEATVATAAAAAAASLVGVAAGASVEVVNDASVTKAEVEDSSITVQKDNAEIHANNSTKLNTVTVSASVSSGGALGATISVNNLESDTAALVNNSTFKVQDVQNGKFDLYAQNNVDTLFVMANVNAGAVAGGVGVSVNNITSGVAAKVAKNSNITAQTASIKAEENIDVDQYTTAGSTGVAGINANTLVTSIGAKAKTVYANDATDADTQETKKSREDMSEQEKKEISTQNKVDLSSANDAVNENSGDKQNESLKKNTLASGAISKGNMTQKGQSASVDRLKGTQAYVGESSITTTGATKIAAKKHNAVDVNAVSAAVGGAAVNLTVGVLDVTNNTGVNLNAANITAQNIAANANVDGHSTLTSVQAAGGGAAANASLAMSLAGGENHINVEGGSMTAQEGSITLAAVDQSGVSAHSVGATVGGFAGGLLVSQAKNASSNAITLAGANLRATQDVNIAAKRKNNVVAETTGGALGFATLQGMVALAGDNGSNTVSLGKIEPVDTEIEPVNTEIEALNIKVSADSAPAVKADAQAYSAGIVSAGATVAIAKETAQTELQVADDTKLAANNKIELNAKMHAGEGKYNVEALATGVSASIGAGVAANVAKAVAKSTVTADLGLGQYNAGTMELTGDNSTKAHADTQGVTLAVGLASGWNKAIVAQNLTTNVMTHGTQAGSKLGELTITGASSGGVNLRADGNSGGIVAISPYAASANNNLTTNTTVTISGNTWNGIDNLIVAAKNSDDVDVDVDAVSASVLNASGTQIDNTITHTAAINNAAKITTTGAQKYHAGTIVDQDVQMKSSGYGVVSGASAKMNNTLTYNAKVDVTGAKLRSTGDEGGVTLSTDTKGDMDYYNSLKSAGMAPATYAESTNNITYTNELLTGNGTEITSQSSNHDITFAASDNTNVNLKTVADTQGGAVGAASAKTTSTFKRFNTVQIGKGTQLESTNDLNLYAGADDDGILSSVDYNITADAYNKTAIPLGTSPHISNTMKQANAVTIQQGANADSVRHVNIKAQKGISTIANSAREYNFYTGSHGSGSVTSTLMGEQNDDEQTANKVDVSGNVRAGIHGNLQVDVTGKLKVNNPDQVSKDRDNRGIDSGDINIAVKADNNWFDKKNIEFADKKLTNPYKARYDEINNIISQYDSESAEYKLLKRDKEQLESLMKDFGFADDKAHGKISVYGDKNVLALDVSKIVVSGGNINIDTDEVAGSGSLTAQGANNVKITNDSDVYLAINGIEIKDRGGEVRYNDAAVNELPGLRVNASANTDDPMIEVHSTGRKQDILNSSPDIGIFGKVANSSGKIQIINENSDIFMGEKSEIAGRDIIIAAAKGSVVQQSNGWLPIGGYPVSRYQFDSAIATKIQKYLSLEAAEDGKTHSFATDAAYFNWLLSAKYDDKGNKIAESLFGFTSKEMNTIRQAKAAAINRSVGTHAGKNVYITARDIILDGLVQSGYQNYKVKLTTGDIAKVEAIKNAYVQSGTSRKLADDDVLGNKKYLVHGTETGDVFNETTGVWEYGIRVYYNPSTDKLLTEEVEPNGGKIYITGNVSSTRNGRIMAMNGTPDISIDTSAVEKDLVVNKITNNNIEGLISIKDTGNLTTITNRGGELQLETGGITKNVWNTVYRDVKFFDRIIPLRFTVQETVDAGQQAVKNDDGTVTYKPQPGYAISWTGGSTGGKEITTKQYKKDFVLWGGIKYNTTDDFVKQVEMDGGKIDAGTTETISGDKTLKNGVVLTNDSKLRNNAYTVTTDKHLGNKIVRGEIVEERNFDGFWGTVLGYGEMVYTWTETKGMSTTSTYSIRADKDITAGFLVGGKGNISVKSNKDMTLNGNISSAVDVNEMGRSAIGEVTLKSQQGAIDTNGNARVSADKLTVEAVNGINLNQGTVKTTLDGEHALAGQAEISLKNTNGDVNVVSDRGDLLVTTTDMTNSNLNIRTAGDIKNAEGAVLKGKRIDLTSLQGGIEAEVAPGQALEGGTMTASLNADAARDIKLHNSNGDMRIGHIVSHNGDVMLETTGSFVDAVGDMESSGTNDRIDLWRQMGLIKGDNAADKEEAAADSKALRLNALEARAKGLAENKVLKAQADKTTYDEVGVKNAVDTQIQNYKTIAKEYVAYLDSEEMQKAHDAYVKAVRAHKGENDQLKEAYQAYAEAQDKFFAEKDYTADEINLIKSYGEVSTSDAYGWSLNELLYAVQYDILNSDPSEVTTVDQPNIAGKNITLKAKNSIGVDASDIVVSYADLSQEDNLKLLADAKAGDLTWDDEVQKVAIRKQNPLTVQLGEGGRITVESQNGENVYLAGVKDTKLDITGCIATGKDVKLLSDKGVSMNNGIVAAKNLTIKGGAGDIGSETHAINTNISGNLEATTGKDVYIHQTSANGEPVHELTVMRVAGQRVDISADNGMKMTTETGKDMGLVEGEFINLTAAAGNIGVANDSMRIKNGAIVNANAGNGNVYLAGKESGTLVIAELSGNDVVLTSEGNLSFGKEAVGATETQEAQDEVEADVNVKTLQANAQKNITQVNGSIVARDSETNEGSVIWTAEQIVQNGGSITTNTANLTANAGGIALNNATITGEEIMLKARKDADGIAQGAILQGADHSIVGTNLHMEATDGIAVASGDGDADDETALHNEIQNVTIHNTDANADVTVIGGKNAEDRTITFAEGSTGKNVTVKNVAVDNDTTASNMTIAGAVQATNNVVLANEEEAVLNVNNAVHADKDVIMISEGDITANGAIDSGAETNVTAKNGSASVNGSITSGANANVTAVEGNVIVTGNISSVWDTNLKAETVGKVEVSGDVSGENVTATTDKGAITLGGKTTATNGDVKLTTKEQGDISTTGAVSATQNVTAKTNKGDITATANVTAGDNVVVKAVENGGITASGNLRATNGAITVTTANGDILLGTTNSDTVVNAGTSVNVTTNVGDVQVYSDVTSGIGTTVESKKGNTTVNGTIDSGAETNVTAKNGSASVNGSITSGANANVTAVEGNVIVTGNISSVLDTNLTAETVGKVEVSGDVSGENVTATTDKGAITLGGTTTATNGYVKLTTKEQGDISTTGAVSATQNVTATTDKGSITLGGTTKATNGDVTLTTNKGDITAQGVVEAGHDLQAVANTTGNIVFDGQVNASNDITADSKQAGSITLHADVTAGNNATMYTNDGTILFVGHDDASTEDVKLTAERGDINIKTTGTGDIKDTHRNANGDRGFVQADDGNVTITHSGTGSVDLYGIKAQNDATVSVQDGDLHVSELSGDTVGVTVKNPNKEMDIEHLEAKREIKLSAANINLDKVTQRSDGEDMLNIKLDGAEADQPIENLTIGDIQTNNTGVDFPHLWVRNANVTTSKGKFYLDNLYVLGKGTFSNGDMKTEVFGSVPIYNTEVESSYWINTGINSPKNYPDEWQNATKNNPRWMYLHFEGQEPRQFSNGNLLDLDPYYYVYRQRYTMTDWMRVMHYRDFYDIVEDELYILGNGNEPQNLSMYNRYDLLQYEPVNVENADEDEIKI